MSGQPTTVATDGRVFACSPGAVLAMIVDEDERFLLLRHPRHGGWVIVNGGLEADESLVDAMLREVAEEAGPDVRVRPLGVVHACTWRYDEVVTHMIDVFYLLAYEGGEVVPGDDMAGSEVCWATLEEITSGAVSVAIPQSHEHWLFTRALDLHRLLKDAPPVPLA